MSVGLQGTTQSIDNGLTNTAVQLRNLMNGVANLNTWVNGQDNGLAFLEELGYSSTANADNPGGISDAQYALNLIAYLNTIAGIYYGTAAQPDAFNFNNELSQIWGGQ
jgi:hypothetical protein